MARDTTESGEEVCGSPDGVAATPPAEATTEESTHRQEIHNGHAQELIDTVATKMSGEFGVREIEECIHAQFDAVTVNRTTIAGRLRKLVDLNKIELIQQGVGHRPSKFRGKAA